MDWVTLSSMFHGLSQQHKSLRPISMTFFYQISQRSNICMNTILTFCNWDQTYLKAFMFGDSGLNVWMKTTWSLKQIPVFNISSFKTDLKSLFKSLWRNHFKMVVQQNNRKSWANRLKFRWIFSSVSCHCRFPEASDALWNQMLLEDNHLSELLKAH